MGAAAPAGGRVSAHLAALGWGFGVGALITGVWLTRRSYRNGYRDGVEDGRAIRRYR